MSRKVFNQHAEAVGPIAEEDHRRSQLSTVHVEVTGAVSEAPFPRVSVTSTHAEVAAPVHEEKFERSNLSTVHVEALATVARRVPGIILDRQINLQDFTLFAMLRGLGWAGDGIREFGLHGTFPSLGLLLSEGATDGEIYLTLKPSVEGYIRHRVALPSSDVPLLLSVQWDRANQQVTARINQTAMAPYDSFGTAAASLPVATVGGMVALPEKQQSAQLAELIVYDTLLVPFNIEQVENYLYCKWVYPGPNPGNNMCVPF